MSGNFPQSKGSDSANEQARAARAAELGLPESATWADINEQARAARAAETGAAIRTLEQ